MKRNYAFLALLLPLASACYKSQCFTKADIGTCIPLAVSKMAIEYQTHINGFCIPLYGYGVLMARAGLECVLRTLTSLNQKCRAKFGNKCIVYLGLYGLVYQKCKPTVTVEGIPINQWVGLNKNKRGVTCPLQFKFPRINKRCPRPRKKVAGKA